jgi:rSAM/selenodomain-associated transferase 2
MPALSIVIPTLNEEAGIAATLARLAELRAAGSDIIVADGGSHDHTVEVARPLCDQVVSAPRGRGAQMNAGAAMTRGTVLLFLHADTCLPPAADRLVLGGLAHSKREWGRFDVRIVGRHPLLPTVAALMNWRSRLTGIATGDQAIFVKRSAFAAAGGFPDIPLMEDIVLSKQLRRMTAPLCLPACVTTSGRRWDERGLPRTILLMWRLRAALFLGADPKTLARVYGYVPREP